MKRLVVFGLALFLILSSVVFVSASPDLKAGGSDGPITVDENTVVTLSWSIPSAYVVSPVPGLLLSGICYIFGSDGTVISVVGYTGGAVTPPLKSKTTYDLTCYGGSYDSVTVNVLPASTGGSPTATSCSDSDGGENPYVSGTLTGYYSNGGSLFIKDSCTHENVSNSTVKEGVCQNDMPNTVILNCPNGCFNGACNVTNQTSGVSSDVSSAPKNTNIVSGICEERSSDSKEINEGDAGTILGISIAVIEAEEGNLLFYANLNIDGQGVNLTSDSPSTQLNISGQIYTVELVSASDTSATVQVTCGIKKLNQCTQGSFDSAEINEGSSESVLGLEVSVTEANETNLFLVARLDIEGQEVILTSDAPTVILTISGQTYTIELLSTSNTSAAIKITCGHKNLISGGSCTQGDSDFKEIAEGDAGTIFGIGVSVVDADETNTQLSATLNVGGQTITLTSNSPASTVILGGQTYTVELLSASDTSATIRIICGKKPNINNTNQNSCKIGETETKEIAEGDVDSIFGLGVAVLDADETNIQLSATLNVANEVVTLTSDVPAVTVTISDQVYTIEIVSASDTSATIKITCGDTIDDGFWIDIIAFFKRFFNRD